MHLAFRNITILSVFIGALTLSGCATVELSMPGSESAQQTTIVKSASSGHTERQALINAVAQLEQTPWPEVTETPLAARMVSVLFGGDADDSDHDGHSREEAIGIYVASLQAGSSDPLGQLVSDADKTLHAARNVAESGRLAATAINPNADDVLVLEEAIGDVRQCRDMYLAAIKKLQSEGHDVPGERAGELKAAFTQTIRDIGDTADVVAQRASQDEGAYQYADTTADPAEAAGSR